MTLPSIASRARKCRSLFEEADRVIILPSGGLLQFRMNDQFDRFKIWSGSIGALQEPSTASSLDHRLKDVPRIRVPILHFLDDLNETLQKLLPIVAGQRPNRYTSASEMAFQLDALSLEVGLETNSDDTETPISELEELLKFVTSTITNLFRMSPLMEKATIRDRYAKAQNSYRPKLDSQYDIAHVGQKFPRVHEKPWLESRLGRAITMRRTFLRYCKQHHHRPAAEQRPLEVSAIANPEDGIAGQKFGLEATPQHQGSVARGLSIPASTTASTLVPALVHDIEEFSDEVQPPSSPASSTNEEKSEGGLQIPPIPAKGLAHKEFPCPYCWESQTITSQRSWRKHVLRDLKPYVCTFPECDLLLFETRTEWFDHELQHHRVEWSCPFCDHSPVRSPDVFEGHLRSCHVESIPLKRMEAFVEVCKKPIHVFTPGDCPFCEEWSTRVKEENPHSKDQDPLVTSHQFEKHLGYHMEQLALFALPPDLGEVDNGLAADLGNDELGQAAPEPSRSQYELSKQRESQSEDAESDKKSEEDEQVQKDKPVDYEPVVHGLVGDQPVQDGESDNNSDVSNRTVSSSCPTETANNSPAVSARPSNTPQPNSPHEPQSLDTYELYTFTILPPSNPTPTYNWARVRRTSTPLNQKPLKTQIIEQHKRGITPTNQFNAPEMAGYKRKQIERLVEDRMHIDGERFEYFLESVVLESRKRGSGGYKSPMIRVVLRRRFRVGVAGEGIDRTAVRELASEIIDLEEARSPHTSDSQVFLRPDSEQKFCISTILDLSE